MNRNPVGWFEIYVQDTQRAKAFYESVFETRLEKLGDAHMEMWMFPGVKDGGGAPGALVKIEGVPSGGNSTVVYFSSADCAVEADRAARAGGRVMKGKTSIGPYGFIALAFDTEGNLFGIHSLK